MIRRVAAGLMVAWGAAAWAQTPGDAVPSFKVGEVAVYTVNQRADRKMAEEVSTVAAVAADGIRFRHVRADRQPAEIEAVFTADLRQAQSGATGTRYEPPLQIIKPAMTVGDAWKTSTVAVATNQSRSQVDLEVKVVAAEKLTTPAGVFDTYRIESGGWITGISWQGTIRMVQVQWYAPAIGRFVRTEYRDYRGSTLWNDTVTELKSFQAAP